MYGDTGVWDLENVFGNFCLLRGPMWKQHPDKHGLYRIRWYLSAYYYSYAQHSVDPKPLQLILVLLKFFCPFSFLSARCAWPIAEKNHHGSKERLVHQLVPTELADWDDSCGPIPDWTKAPTQLQAIARNMSPPRLLPDCIALKSTARVWMGTCSLLRHCKKRCLDPVGNQSLPQTSSNRVSAASHWPSSYALMAAL